MPRPSKVTTRWWRAKYAIWPFQIREWTIDQVGRNRIVGSPVTVDLVEGPDAVALDVALLVGVASPGLLGGALLLDGD